MTGPVAGFTLDKESNTIAILCQDVTVILAFDTRERLIQWQVKIANNLGEGEWFCFSLVGSRSVAAAPFAFEAVLLTAVLFVGPQTNSS